MGIFDSADVSSMQNLLLHEIKDLYDAEQRLLDALPKMADAAHTHELKMAFQEHLAETEGQVERLERVFDLLGATPETVTCDGMKGLIKEGQEVLKAEGDPFVRDAALIAAAQRVEHYEIASYGSCRTFAERLGMTAASKLLQTTLDEEAAADKKLTSIAEGSVNREAA